MKALEFSRKPVRYAAAMVAGALKPGAGASVGPLKLRSLDRPEPPGPDWVTVRPRLSGICGSDLATIDGTSSRYFEPIVSFPFVPGHEVVGELDDGSRVVVVPVLSCRVRGFADLCRGCAAGDIGRCERIAIGCIEPGLQTGFCESTGGGWSEFMVAHPDQLIAVPDDVTDEQAVLVEPTACAVHAAHAVAEAAEGTAADAPIAVIGAGAIGLLTVAAISHLGVANPLLVGARYPHQQRLAAALGATTVTAPGELNGAVRLATGSLKLSPDHRSDQLAGGAPVVVDCVGSESSLTAALGMVAPGGTVLVVGMPATTTLDLTGLWHRETTLRGVYAYRRDDFATALDVITSRDLERLVTATYPLSRATDAIEHAAQAGPRGAVKIAFDLRDEKERNR